MTWSIQGATLLTPDKVIEKGSVSISGDEIDTVSTRAVSGGLSIDATGCVLSPGLINAHDHLLGNYFPKVGDHRPYENWLPWDNDLKSAEVYRERQRIENRDLYILAGYRNLISGVTLVADLIPHFVNEPFLDLVPTKILTDYTLAHSVASFALSWGDGISAEHQKAVDGNMPFITHCSEGFDDETRRDVRTLERLGALDEYTVLVHGLAFSKDDIDLLKKKNVHVVWCADSNLYMYEKTTDIGYLLEKGVNVSIGTDSPMSGSLNILEEMRIGRKHFLTEYGKDLPDKQIVRMVTANPSKALRLEKNGKLEEGYLADLVLFAANDAKDPYSAVVDAKLRDVRLVVIEGLPVYGSSDYAALFDGLDVKYQRVVIDGAEKLVVGDLLGLMKRISKAVGFKKELPFMPVEFEI
jgi:cytosine/adenosine deaminase-related metal-dependent hydrolase